MSKWQIAPFHYEKFQDVKALWFEGDEGLVFGEQREGSADSENPEAGGSTAGAFIFRKDTGAETLRKVFGGRGSISAATEADGVLYVLGRWSSSQGTDHSYLLRSTDRGQSFTEVKTNLPAHTKGIAFASRARGFAWEDAIVHVSTGVTAFHRHIFVTHDGGAHWKLLFRGGDIDRSEAKPLLDGKGGIWLPEPQGLVHAHPARKPALVAAWPQSGFAPSCLARGKDGAVWLVGAAQDQSGNELDPPALFQLVGNRFERVSEVGDYLVEDMHIGQRVLSLVVADTGRRPDDAPKHYLLRSHDGGKSWDREAPPIRATVTPIYFEDEERVWAHATFGRFQVRRPPPWRKSLDNLKIPGVLGRLKNLVSPPAPPDAHSDAQAKTAPASVGEG